MILGRSGIDEEMSWLHVSWQETGECREEIRRGDPVQDYLDL